MLLLVKVQSEKYIKDMYENQYLYFSSLKEFRSNKSDITGRLDPKELNLTNKQIKYLSVNVGNKEIELSKISMNFNAQFSEYLTNPKINCCSLYSIILKDGLPSSTIDDRILTMGDKALIIYDYNRFFEILDKSILDNKMHYSRRFITYYNPKTHDGEISLHHKNNIFQFQQEYRVLISPTNNQPVKIPIPELKEISTVIDSNKLKTLSVRLISENDD